MRPVWVIPAAALAATAVVQAAGLQRSQTFRDRTLLVPIDVRAVDGHGEPVRDLRLSDFIVTEDGIAQEIAHFASVDFERVADVAVGERQPVAPTGPTGPEERTFLMVLGRGRLQGPARGLEAAMTFVQSGLRPQDFVGVVAYDRATDLTRDREPILRLLQRYQARHESIEARLDHWFGGLNFLFVSRVPPPGAQAEIDALFDDPGLPRTRRLAGLDAPAEDRVTDLPDMDTPGIAEIGDAPAIVATRDDLDKLYSAVSYLRNLDGEKHLIFVSEEGLLGLGRSEDADGFAAMAADARVTVSTIHTGGLSTSWGEGVFMGPNWGHIWAMLDSRSIASISGGVSSSHQFASKAFDTLARTMGTSYVLGYYPTNRVPDGQYRRIAVTTTRPGVRLIHRRGYYAREGPPPADRRTVMAHARITSAGAYRMPIRDVGVSLRASYASRGAAGWRVKAEVAIDPGTIRFREVDGRQVAALNVAIFFGNLDEKLVGEAWKTIDLQLDAATFERLQRESIVYETTVDLRGAGPRIKAVVYDFLGDRVGTTVREIR